MAMGVIRLFIVKATAFDCLYWVERLLEQKTPLQSLQDVLFFVRKRHRRVRSRHRHRFLHVVHHHREEAVTVPSP